MIKISKIIYLFAQKSPSIIDARNNLSYDSYQMKKSAQKRLLYGNVTEEQVLYCLKHMVEVITFLYKYPKGNPAIVENVKNLHEKIQSIFDPRNQLVISEFYGQIMINDVMLPLDDEESNPIAVLIFHLLLHNLKSVTFKKQFTEQELRDFLAILTTHQKFQQGSLPSVLSNSGINNIAVELQSGSIPSFESKNGLKAENKNSQASKEPIQFSNQSKTVEKPDEMLPVSIFVKLGPLNLDGVRVKILGHYDEGLLTCDQKGAIFNLGPGNYIAQIEYFNYTLTRNLHTESAQSQIEINLMSLFQ